MRVLMIGGTGFIGERVLGRLPGAGHDVAVFHRGQTGEALPSEAQYIRGERKDLPAFAADFKKFAPDVVLDMIPYTEQDALDVMKTFRGIARRVVAISSMDVYRAYGCFTRLEGGDPDPSPFDEDAPLRTKLYPYRPLAQSQDDLFYDYEKIVVERIIMGDAEMPGTVLRLPQVYGPGDKQHRTFEHLKRMDDGRPAILLEERRAQWRWTRSYVNDVAAAIALAVANERAANRIYNVGEAEALTEADWVRSIGKAAGWDGEVIALAADRMPKHLLADYDWRHNLAADTNRIRKELGFHEIVSREEALQQTVTWERQHPQQEVNAALFDYAAEDAVLKRLQREGD